MKLSEIRRLKNGTKDQVKGLDIRTQCQILTLMQLKADRVAFRIMKIAKKELIKESMLAGV